MAASTDQQQTFLPRNRIWRPMHTGWHGHLRMPRGDAPEVSDAKRVVASAFTLREVQIMKMLRKPFFEAFVVATSKKPQKRRPCLRHFDTRNGILGKKAF
jgi:hypothetical protein